jgi:PKD repeat protein
MGRRWFAALLIAVALPGCHKQTITQPTLSASCQAQPASGAAPLAVAFLVSVAGAEGPFTVAVSYGDGASGSNPDLPHTYAGAGSYTASFTVTTATQSARCVAAVTVGAPSASPAGGNRPPDAVFKTTPAAAGSKISGTAPLTVRFNMCASSDPDGDGLYFLMDFDGNGKFDSGGTTGASCRQDHTYATVGTWNPELCLHDITPDRVPLHDDQCRSYVVETTP